MNSILHPLSSTLSLADSLRSLRWLVDNLPCCLVEVQHTAFSVGLNCHRDCRLCPVAGMRVEYRLLPTPHAAEKVHHVGFARLALDLDFNPIPELRFETVFRNFLRRDGNVVDFAFKLTVRNHDDCALMATNQAGYVSVISHRRR